LTGSCQNIGQKSVGEAVDSFLILGLVLIVSLAMLQFVVSNWWLRALGAIIISLIAAWVVAQLSGPIWLGPDDENWYDASPYAEGILFSLMVLGMGARLLSLAIEQRREKLKSLAVDVHAPALRIDRWEFVYPMLFAVPTFGAILSQIDSPGLSVAAVILAFQTGFFWQTVLKSPEQAKV
jgi:hypothetical protein